MVTLSLLGPLEAYHDDGTRIELGRRKQRALLAVLALSADQVVPLDRLVELLWPDEPPDKAIGSVQGYVSNLRRALEPDRTPRMPSQVIVTQAPGYRLRRDAVDLDATRFQSLVARGEQLLAAGDAAAALEALGAALDMWRGPAVADFAGEPFAVAESARLDDLRLVATEDRIEADLALGHHDRVVGELEALVAHHPVRERLWGLLMLGLYRAGRQAEALRSFQRARTVLADELGLEPGPTLRDLEAGILAHAPDLDYAGPVRAGLVPAPAPAAAPAARPFVGRRAELGLLAGALAEARSGHGRVVLITGDAGIGKTRLCEELIAAALGEGVLVAWGRAHGGRGAPAFWPWVQVVRTVAAAVDPDELAGAIGDDGPDLAPVVRDLPGLPDGPVGPPIDADAARFRFYEALTALLVRLSARRPLLVVLDDVHWADAGSLELLGRVAAAARDAAVLVLATYRSTEETPALTRALAELARQPATGRSDLVGLSAGDVGRLLAAELGTEPDEGVARAVHVRTDGNPFFVVELVRLLTWRPVGDELSAVDLARDVPGRVRDVLRDRLARLPEGTNALLELAAVAGHDVELALLEHASGLDTAEVVRLLDGALARGLLTGDDGGAPGALRFTHALVRDALYTGLSSVRRAQLHGRVARALEHLYPSDDERAAALALHATEAAAIEGHAGAVTHLVRAADVAQARMAFEEAQDHLDRALGLIEHLPAGLERDGAELSVQLRSAAWRSITSGWTAPRTKEAWSRAGALCERVGATDQLAAAMWGLYVLSIMTGEPATSIDVTERLLELARTTGDPRIALVADTAAAYNLWHRGHLVEAHSRTEAALPIALAFGADELLQVFSIDLVVLMLGTSALGRFVAGDEADSMRRTDAALARIAAVDHPFSHAAGLALVATVAAIRGDAAASLPLSEEAVAVSQRHGIRHYNIYARAVHGWAVATLGDSAAGVAELEAAIASMDAMGWVLQRPIFCSLLAQARQQCGRTAGALDAVEDGLRACEAYEERFWEAELWRQRAELVTFLDPLRRDEADASLSRAAEVAAAQGATGLADRIERTRQAVTGTGRPTA